MTTPAMLVLGDVLTPLTSSGFRAQTEAGIAFDSPGRIVQVGSAKELIAAYPQTDRLDTSGCLILPGLIDTHSHVSQHVISAAGTPPLLDWLRDYVYPAERRFSDPARADETRRLCDTFFRQSLAHGTTTTNTLTTSSLSASEIACASAEASGIRALVGMVLMDFGGPEAHSLLRSAEDALADLDQLRQRWHGRAGRIAVTVAPRGVFACTEALLRQAGEFADHHGLLVHSHLDMDEGFRAYIGQRFPHAADTLAVFEQANCLGPRRVWAHATGLTTAEIARFGPTTGVAHCGPSNLFWSMGLMPLRAVLRSGASVGLGSDSGGGPTESLFDVMRAAGDISRLFPDEVPASVEELLTLATLGGARALGMDQEVGSLEVGKAADFLIVDDSVCDPLTPTQRSPFRSLSDRLSRTIYRAHPAMIRGVYVAGQPCFVNGSLRASV